MIIENKWTLEIFYTFIISLICMIIVLRTDKFFKLSSHQGIRYFRNAFFFYGIAFIARYIFEIFSNFPVSYASAAQIIFEYFFVMAGFFLFYSLVWKKFELNHKYTSSLFNSKIIIFHMIAAVIALFDFLWQTYFFMFFSQIIIFAYAAVIAYMNYKKEKDRKKFSKFYFIAIILSLAAWILNLLAASYFAWNKWVLIGIGIINIIFFLLILYGVVKVTRK